MSIAKRKVSKATSEPLQISFARALVASWFNIDENDQLYGYCIHCGNLVESRPNKKYIGGIHKKSCPVPKAQNILKEWDSKPDTLTFNWRKYGTETVTE